MMQVLTTEVGQREKTLLGTQDGRAYFSSGRNVVIEHAQIAYFRCTLSFEADVLRMKC